MADVRSIPSVDWSVISFRNSRSVGKSVPNHTEWDESTDIAYSYKLAAIKMVTPSKEHLEEHYKDLSDKPFFKGLVTCALRSHWMKCRRKALMVRRHVERTNRRYGLGGT